MKKKIFSLCLLLLLSNSISQFAQEQGRNPEYRAPYHYINPVKNPYEINLEYSKQLPNRIGTTINELIKVSGDDWAFAYNCYDPNGMVPEGTVLFTDSGIVSTGGTVTNFLCAGTFDVANQTWYAFGYPGYDFYSVNYLTGDMEFIGSNGSIGIRGLAYDLNSDQLFGVDANSLYLIDNSTGICTLIGPSGLNLNYIALACSPAGLLYGFDMNNDALYLIDNMSGSASLVGTFPFDVIYAQSADFDLDNNILFWTTFLSESGTGVLYVVDPTNANLTFIEFISLELDAFGIYSAPIPVELNSFTADVINYYVKLTWITATEKNNSGFEIQRKKSGDRSQEIEWEALGFVPGFGTTTEVHHYSFMDESLQSGNYQYRLKQIDFDGTYEYSNIIEVTVDAPTIFSLEQNYPNPFNPNTKIKFTIPASLNPSKGGTFVTLKVYDILGKAVTTLVNEEQSAGVYETEFDGTGLPSGVYFYQLKAGSFVETKKMVLLR
jgi:hypothetical protein